MTLESICRNFSAKHKVGSEACANLGPGLDNEPVIILSPAVGYGGRPMVMIQNEKMGRFRVHVDVIESKPVAGSPEPPQPVPAQ